jgi:hypothetical protein
MAEADTESDDKYGDGKIYRLDYGGLTYIGSTIQSLQQREWKHRSLDCTSKLLYEQAAKDGGTVIMTLIEDYPCKSKKELARREGFYQQQIECVNKQVAGRTRTESLKAYYEANKEANWDTILEYKRAWSEALPTVTCECGGKYKRNQSRHIKTQQHQRFVAASSHSEDVS